MLSDVRLSVCRVHRAYVEKATEVAHVTRDSGTTFKVKRSKVKVTRPLWLVVLAGQHGHRVSDRSICVYDVYRVTTCRPGRGILRRPPAYSLSYWKMKTFISNSPESRPRWHYKCICCDMHSILYTFLIFCMILNNVGQTFKFVKVSDVHVTSTSLHRFRLRVDKRLECA